MPRSAEQSEATRVYIPQAVSACEISSSGISGSDSLHTSQRGHSAHAGQFGFAHFILVIIWLITRSKTKEKEARTK